MKLIFVSGNKNKVSEYQESLAPVKIEVRDIDIPEIQSLEIEEIAKDKAVKAYKEIQAPLIVEDVELKIKSLNNFPGPFIKWVKETVGNKGILKLLQEIEDRTAEAVACICYYNGTEFKILKGVVSGKIASEELGKGGWGFDPIFIPKGQTKTYAELGMPKKHEFSHRGAAIKMLKEYLSNSSLNPS